MRKFYPCLFLFFFPFTTIWSQKIYPATRLEQAPFLDGIPDDVCWQQITPTDIPLTSTPVFGQPALPSTVRLFYTSDALYVAATFSGQNVRYDGSQRDNQGLGDWFSIGLDTWDDDQNAFVFTVTAAGVQTEQRVGGNATATNWDAVWQSAVTRQADGWSVEIRLPFTALRFPARGEQHWGLQFSRFDRSSGTLSTWNPRRPQIKDEVLQYGVLEGLNEIRQRQRLSAAVQSSVDQVFSHARHSVDRFGQAAFGVDGRWGFRSNSTLDIALLPGSTINWPNNQNYSKIFDLNFLNNAALPEPRQLLTEESPMFDKSGIFLAYPMLQLQFNDLPVAAFWEKYNYSKIWTAAKFSTRLPGNIGIGIYSTLLGPSSLVFRPITSGGEIGPSETRQITGISNYNLVTIEKALPNNSWVSLSNANVVGRLSTHNNLSSLGFQLRERSNQYQIAGNIQMNIPEVKDTIQRGQTQYNFSVSKVNGLWTWQLAHQRNKLISDDILNAGPSFYSKSYYISANSAELGYRDYTTHGWRQNTGWSLQLNQTWRQQISNFDPLKLKANLFVLDRRFQLWTVGLSSELQKKLRVYVFSSRLNLIRRLSPFVSASFSFLSDNRKRFYYSVSAGAGSNLGGEASRAGSSLQLNWIINPRFRLQAAHAASFTIRGTIPLPDVPTPGYYLRQFNLFRLDNNLTMNWYCSPRFNLFAELSWTNVTYQKQRALQVQDNNKLDTFDYAFGSLSPLFVPRIGLGIQWFFAPLSQLRFQFFGQPPYDSSEYTSAAIAQTDFTTTQANLSFIYFIDGNRK